MNGSINDPHESEIMTTQNLLEISILKSRNSAEQLVGDYNEVETTRNAIRKAFVSIHMPNRKARRNLHTVGAETLRLA